MEARLIFKKALSLPANFRLKVIDDIWQYAQTSDETFTIEQIEAELIAEEKKYVKAYS